MPLTVYTPRWRDTLNRIFVGKRQGISDLVVLDDVFPTAALFDETQGEFHLGRGEYSWGAASLQVPGVGRNWNGWIINPAGSGNIVVIESIRVAGVAAGAGFLWAGGIASYPGGAVFPTPGPAKTDGRGQVIGNIAPAPPAVQTGYIDQVGGPPGRQIYAWAPVNTATIELLPEAADVVLAPGQAFTFGPDQPNLSWLYNAFGYDRAAEPSDS